MRIGEVYRTRNDRETDSMAYPPNHRVVVRSISKLTGSITVEVIDPFGAYRRGDRLVVNQWELSAQPDRSI